MSLLVWLLADGTPLLNRYREVHTEGSGKPRGTLGFIDGD